MVEPFSRRVFDLMWQRLGVKDVIRLNDEIVEGSSDGGRISAMGFLIVKTLS